MELMWYTKTIKDKKGIIKMKIVIASVVSYAIAVAKWFISAGFILWGWNVIAPHLNAPLFSYWEIFVMRMALSHIMRILWQRPITPIETIKTEEEED